LADAGFSIGSGAAAHQILVAFPDGATFATVVAGAILRSGAGGQADTDRTGQGRTDTTAGKSVIAGAIDAGRAGAPLVATRATILAGAFAADLTRRAANQPIVTGTDHGSDAIASLAAARAGGETGTGTTQHTRAATGETVVAGASDASDAVAPFTGAGGGGGRCRRWGWIVDRLFLGVNGLVIARGGAGRGRWQANAPIIIGGAATDQRICSAGIVVLGAAPATGTLLGAEKDRAAVTFRIATQNGLIATGNPGIHDRGTGIGRRFIEEGRDQADLAFFLDERERDEARLLLHHPQQRFQRGFGILEIAIVGVIGQRDKAVSSGGAGILGNGGGGVAERSAPERGRGAGTERATARKSRCQPPGQGIEMSFVHRSVSARSGPANQRHLASVSCSLQW